MQTIAFALVYCQSIVNVSIPAGSDIIAIYLDVQDAADAQKHFKPGTVAIVNIPFFG